MVVPRLVDIISAVPQEVKDILLPKLRAKPVRTASGVSGDHPCQAAPPAGALTRACGRSLSSLSCPNLIAVLTSR